MNTHALAVLSLGILLASTASAQNTPADPVLAELGQPVYTRYCVSCHGASGQGDGPVAPVLRPMPADLTKIAERRGGTFPAGEIARTIDGRFAIAAHGKRAMPVWGERFGGDIPESDVGESIARGRIVTLVEYLKSIQHPPLAPPPPEDEDER